MTGRENVVKGIECCLGDTRTDLPNLCTICPYAHGSYATQTCGKKLREDALALLQAQEPRVMTLEEVQALHANDVVWLEDKGKPNIIPGIVRNRCLWPHSATMVTNFMCGDGCKVTADDDDYGKRWRCWTSRPDEQRMAETPWE